MSDHGFESDREHKEAVIDAWCELNGVDPAELRREIDERAAEIRQQLREVIFGD